MVRWETVIPVFSVAEIPEQCVYTHRRIIARRRLQLTHAASQVLDRFITQANGGTSKCEFDEPQCVLMTSRDLSKLAETTEPPVSEATSREVRFLGCDPDQIIAYAQEHLKGSDLSHWNMVILDERTAADDTCLLISEKDIPDEMGKWHRVRSDFESSIICLMVKETFVGGDELLGTDYEGFDGVLGNEVRQRAEEAEYGRERA